MTAKAFTLTIGTVLLTAFAQVVLKIGVSSPPVKSAMATGVRSQILLAFAASPGVWAGLLIYGVGALLWLAVLARLELSVAYPFVALGFVLTSAFGYFCFNDEMTIGRVGGTILVIAGVYLVARG